MKPRRFALLCAAVLSAGCVTPPEEPAPPGPIAGPSRLTLMGDTARRLVMFAAEASDSAAVRARIAVGERTIENARQYIGVARSAAAHAGEHASAAIAQGDRIGTLMVEAPSSGPFDFRRYWEMGRDKLELTVAHAGFAQQVAEAALACAEPKCLKMQAEALETHMRVASGAARDAESLIRIALYWAY